MKHKFNAKKAERKGHKFHSRLEAKYADRLDWLVRAGDVVFYLQQVPIHLPGGVKYVADFLVFHASGDAEFVDVKGVDTPLSKAKRKIVEDLYPIKISVVTKDDF